MENLYETFDELLGAYLAEDISGLSSGEFYEFILLRTADLNEFRGSSLHDRITQRYSAFEVIENEVEASIDNGLIFYVDPDPKDGPDELWRENRVVSTIKSERGGAAKVVVRGIAEGGRLSSNIPAEGEGFWSSVKDFVNSLENEDQLMRLVRR